MSHSDGSESVSSADQDADGTSTADYPSLSDLIDLVQKGRVAPSHMDAFDPDHPTSDESAVMNRTRAFILPILVHLANRAAVVIGTVSWDKIDVLQFATGPRWEERFPLLCNFDKDADPPRSPLLPETSHEYQKSFTSAGRLKKNVFLLSIWVEPHGLKLVRADLTLKTFKWMLAACIRAGPILFGCNTNNNDSSAASSAQKITSAQVETNTILQIQCVSGCNFVLNGALNCGKCYDMRCSVCDRAPKPGDAVRMPGQGGAIAFVACTHRAAVPDKDRALVRAIPGQSAGSFAPSEATVALPTTAPAAQITPCTSAAAAQIASCTAAAAVSEVSLEPPENLSGVAVLTNEALIAHSLELGADDALADDDARVASPVHSRISQEVRQPEDNAALAGDASKRTPSQAQDAEAAIVGSDDDTSEQSSMVDVPDAAGENVAIDGGPRVNHVEDVRPRVQCGPREGFPALPVSLWMAHQPLALTFSDIVPLIRFLDADTRVWEVDDTEKGSSTSSSLMLQAEKSILRLFFVRLEAAIASTMPSSTWNNDFAMTEVRFLRHRSLEKSALQALNRRSEGAQSRHICARVVLRHAPNASVVHESSSPRGKVIELKQVGSGAWWWSVLGGCVFWGDDPFAAITSQAVVLPSCEPAPLEDSVLVDELFVFWTRPSKSGRMGTIGKAGPGKVLNKAPEAAVVTAALFNDDDIGLIMPRISSSTPSASTLLRWIGDNRMLLRVVTHFSICLNPATPHLRFVFTVDRDGNVFWPLSIEVRLGAAIVHGSVDSATLSIYEKRPPKPAVPKRPLVSFPRCPTPVDLSFNGAEAEIITPALKVRRISQALVVSPPQAAVASGVSESAIAAVTAAMTQSQTAVLTAAVHAKEAFDVSIESLKQRVGALEKENAELRVALVRAQDDGNATHVRAEAAGERLREAEARAMVGEARVEEKKEAVGLICADAQVLRNHVLRMHATQSSDEALRLGMTFATISNLQGKTPLVFPQIPKAPDLVPYNP
jgi:hypothetical protein